MEGSASIGATQSAAMRSSRFRSSRATFSCATTGSAPWVTKSCTAAARFFSWNSWSLSALRCWRLLCGGGGLTPFAVEGSVGVYTARGSGPGEPRAKHTGTQEAVGKANN